MEMRKFIDWERGLSVYLVVRQSEEVATFVESEETPHCGCENFGEFSRTKPCFFYLGKSPCLVFSCFDITRWEGGIVSNLR